MTKYAQQTQFIYGAWDYVGEEDGDRLLFDTRQEAEEDLQSMFNSWDKDKNSQNEWRVVVYDPSKDTKSDL